MAACPASTSCSTTALPMYPAPPVTRTRINGLRAWAGARRQHRSRCATWEIRGLLREQPPPRGEADQIDRGVRVQLAQDPAPVRLHGARADAELLGDLRRRISLD